MQHSVTHARKITKVEPMKTKKVTPLKATRLQRKESVRKVAGAVGTNPGNLSRVENGKQRASPDLAERLANHFGHAITELQILYPERYMQPAFARG